ncbi:MAG: protein translocase SEC61 complex subunit gamma [Nanobdellota archaeon]
MKLLKKAKIKLNEYWRVLRVTKKPDSMEFKTIIKVSGLGMILIGLIGFIIQLTWEIMT